MKNNKKTLRNKHIWFSVWNTKKTQPSPICDTAYRPTRISNK